MRRWTQLIIALAALATLAGIAATVATEVVMVPTSSERTQLIALLVSIAAVSITIAVVFRLFAPRSLTRRMLIAAISGPVVVAVALSAGSRSMFLSEHDLQFLLILLAFATVLGIGVMHTLALPLTEDLARLTEVARRVGEGDLEARAELERMDEVGDLAAAIDSMVDQIASSRAARDEAERERSITLASLSHDARTPLTSMRLATEALIDGVAPDPDRYLRTIASDIDAVETLIADLFTIGQLEAGRLEITPGPVDAMNTVYDVAECMAPIAAEKSISLMVSGPDEVSVIADSSQLHRVLSNLVANAIRHSPIGESVCIDVDGAMRRISVLDNGAGFDADFVNEAFQPFRRQDEARERSHGGAGLGLAVSKGIIEALDGKIWAEPGPGGAVHVELPA
jgi:signal transduction histidine kinase